MKQPEPHKNEEARQAAVESYDVLDTMSETDYDNITKLAAYICKTPISLITILDNNRNWFKSHHGTDINESPRAISFCGHAINSQEWIFEVSDLRSDERFHDNPIVVGETNVVFYAGIPLVADEGLPLGTLCVLDHEPRTLDEDQKIALKALSEQVMNILNLRKRDAELKKALNTEKERYKELERFASIAAHDLKSPLKSIHALTQMLLSEYQNGLSEEVTEIIGHIDQSSDRLSEMVGQLLAYSRDPKYNSSPSEEIDLKAYCFDVLDLVKHRHEVKLRVHGDIPPVRLNKMVLERILMNLFSNAIKYNQNEVAEVDVRIKEDDELLHFEVSDNGIGIDPSQLDKVFDIFHVAAHEDRDGNPGHGIGLAAVRNLVRAQGGKIYATSEPGAGSTFHFSLKHG